VPPLDPAPPLRVMILQNLVTGGFLSFGNFFASIKRLKIFSEEINFFR
jgi:hypothetical protein